MIIDVGKSAVLPRFFGHLFKGTAVSQRSNFSGAVRWRSVYDRLRVPESRPFQKAATSNTQILKCFFSSERSSPAMGRVQFENVCSETLESLTEYFEELIETVPKFRNADVQYSDGVLTVTLGDSDGVYVINKQGSNFQIWLSSPKSGPKRYDYIDGTWVYRHDKSTLHSLLNEEIGEFTSEKVDFIGKCLHSKATV